MQLRGRYALARHINWMNGKMRVRIDRDRCCRVARGGEVVEWLE